MVPVRGPIDIVAVEDNAERAKLAIFYAEGKEVEKNFAFAKYLVQKAGSNNYAPALLLKADWQSRGFVYDRDLSGARKSLEQAAALGNSKAKDKLKELPKN